MKRVTTPLALPRRPIGALTSKLSLLPTGGASICTCVMPWKARLDSIQTSPQVDNVGLRLFVVTPTHDHYWELIQRLEAHPCFSDVYPLNQEGSTGEELEVVIQLEHDPWCGEPRPNLARRRGGPRG